MSYTVPATDVYVANNGSRRKFISGEVITDIEAYTYNMPGSTAPATVAELSTAETAEIQALITAGDATTLAAAAAADAVIQAAGVNAKKVSEARTATAAPGGTTGVITPGVDVVTVTSDDANKVITLPVMAVGAQISLRNGATGYELRSSDPATIGINGGTGANAESAIAASTHVWCEGDTATNIICWQRSAAGTLAVTEVAAP